MSGQKGRVSALGVKGVSKEGRRGVGEVVCVCLCTWPRVSVYLLYKRYLCLTFRNRPY